MKAHTLFYNREKNRVENEDFHVDIYSFKNYVDFSAVGCVPLRPRLSGASHIGVATGRGRPLFRCIVKIIIRSYLEYSSNGPIYGQSHSSIVSFNSGTKYVKSFSAHERPLLTAGSNFKFNLRTRSSNKATVDIFKF